MSVYSCKCYILSTKICIVLPICGHFGLSSQLQTAVWGLKLVGFKVVRIGFGFLSRVRVTLPILSPLFEDGSWVQFIFLMFIMFYFSDYLIFLQCEFCRKPAPKQVCLPVSVVPHPDQRVLDSSLMRDNNDSMECSTWPPHWLHHHFLSKIVELELELIVKVAFSFAPLTPTLSSQCNRYYASRLQGVFIPYITQLSLKKICGNFTTTFFPFYNKTLMQSKWQGGS